MGVRIEVRGSFQKTETFLKAMASRSYLSQLAKYGPIGVAALMDATPIDTSKTSASWYYEIIDRPGYFAIHWYNANVEDPGRIPIAAIIQYGHATRSGGYIQGRDYINPVMQPMFDRIVADMWKEVTR